MAGAFRGCTNLSINAADTPDLSGVTDMSSMFRGATSFNQDISSWDVSTITDMSLLFRDATSFNQPLDSWDVSSVTNMSSMFFGAGVFNQDLPSWNTANVTNMSTMFRTAFDFNGDITTWDVSSVTNMSSMFVFASAFNQPIGSWNTGSVTTMFRMFQVAGAFNQNIDSWDVSSVTTMQEMFSSARDFNQPLNSWNVSAVTTMRLMFADADDFNQDLNNWNVSNVTNMSGMFDRASAFNGDISTWNVSAVTTMNSLFDGASSFNQPIGAWDVSSVTDMFRMFSSSAFNQDISGWNVSAVTNMNNMFTFSAFNGDINNWNVSSVTRMRNVFTGAVFNQPLNNWDVSNVTDMTSMFSSAGEFNQDISGWNISNVQFASNMFSGATSFNQDISSWDVSGIANMSGMFNLTFAFDQDLGAWDISNVTSMTGMFNFSGISVANYDNTLIGWDSQPSVQPGVELGAIDVFYCNGETARNSLIAKGWTINDGGLLCPSGEIAMYDGPNVSSTEILDGQATAIDFGYQVQGSGVNRTFTIENQGTAVLNISGVTISGTEFIVNSTVPTTVAQGSSELLDILLTGSSVGTFTETVTVNSDDTDEASFDFTVTGTITATPEPEIAIFDDLLTNEITDGQIAPVDFGSSPQGSDLTKQLRIENKGTSDLNISGISITGSVFSNSTTISAPIAPGTSATIDVILDASTIGVFTETITITNDDLDEPNFTFDLTGEITNPPTAEISVFVGADDSGTFITNGQAAAIDMGSTTQGTDISQVFTLANGGSADLVVDPISVSGSAFLSVTATPIVVPVDGTIRNFTITLDASGPGTFNETVTIANNDPTDNPFTFSITGTVSSSSAPTISGLSNIAIDEDGDTGEISFTVNDADTNVDDLIVDAISDNLSLVDNITLAGTGSNRTLRIVPLPDAFGTATITVTVDDGFNVTSEDFVITVNGVNDIPQITGQRSLSTARNTAITLGLADLIVSDPDNNYPADFTLNISSGSNYTLSQSDIIPNDGFTGSLTVPVAVNDGVDDSPTFDLEITVTNAEIVVTAAGQSQLNGGVISFEDALVGTEELSQLVIENTGSTILTITDVLVEGEDFSLESQIPDPLAPGENTTLMLAFSPSSIGPKSAILTIESLEAQDFIITLTASGLEDIPQIEVINVVTVQPNNKHDFLEIRNIEFYDVNQVYIYSRWGDEVFKTANYNNTDNRFVGNSTDGDELAEGTYYYVIDLNGQDVINGFFLLRR
nr:BspA family leucine-rich repeat surface protein [Fulvivirga aurantia]